MKLTITIPLPIPRRFETWLWGQEWWGRRPWIVLAGEYGWRVEWFCHDGPRHRWGPRIRWTNIRWLQERRTCERCDWLQSRTVQRLW